MVSVTVKVSTLFLALLVRTVTSTHCIALLVEPVVKTKSIVSATKSEPALAVGTSHLYTHTHTLTHACTYACMHTCMQERASPCSYIPVSSLVANVTVISTAHAVLEIIVSVTHTCTVPSPSATFSTAGTDTLKTCREGKHHQHK